MSSRSRLFHIPALAGAVVTLAMLHAAPAAAQANPAAVTLDTCSNDTTGNWRYFGVAAVSPGDPTASVAVDYWVQNKTTRDGYGNAFKAAKGTALRSGDVQIVPFSIEASPLTLGTVRGQANLTVNGKTAVVTQSSELIGTTCGCTPKGCVRTQGYWGNKPGVQWPGDWYRGMNFYGSGMTWQQIYDTPPRGNAYIILAVQFMSEVLNRNAGASAPQGVQDVVAAARDWFASGTSLQTCAVPGSCGQQKVWAAILDVYNNGQYPGAPPHCKD
jgi:hypothetical protein